MNRAPDEEVDQGLLEKIQRFPTSPGVYIMKDASNETWPAVQILKASPARPALF